PGPTFTQLADGSIQVSGSTIGTIAGYQPGGAAVQNASINFDTNFTGNGNGSLGFFSSVLDSLTASINWTNATASTTNGTISGTGTVLTSSGDAAFEGDFPVGGFFDIFAFYLTDCGRRPFLCGS